MRKRTPRSSALTRLGRAVEHAAAILFARSDARASASGWQVTSTGRWNTSRVYRDPRFDRLAACPACSGHGCPGCAGTGRILRPEARSRTGSAGAAREPGGRDAALRARCHPSHHQAWSPR
jgi:hypothetical protein